MANGIILFKTNTNALRKVRDMLKISCKMNGSQVLLGDRNQKTLKEAIKKIEEADLLLQSIT